MSCSAKHIPPVPSTTLNAAPSLACAWAAGTRDSRMSFAATAEMPAVVNPLRKLRREVQCDQDPPASPLIAASPAPARFLLPLGAKFSHLPSSGVTHRRTPL